MKKAKKTTRKEVAEKAGISPMVVSWVTRGEAREHRISEATIKRVKKVAEEMNYQPNLWGRMLKTQKSGLIAFISEGLTYNVTVKLIRAIEAKAHECGYGLLLFEIPSHKENWNNMVNQLKLTLAEGFILHTHKPEDIMKFSSELFDDKPLFLLGDLKNKFKKHSAHIDFVLGAKLGIKHLLDSGCKNIGILASPKDSSFTSLQIKGCKQAQKQYPEIKLTINHAKFSDQDFQSGFETIIKWHESGFKPDGIFALSDVFALGAIRALNQLGIDCPREVKLVGFDGTDLAYMCTPALTTIQQPFEEIGDLAVEHIAQTLHGKKSNKTKCHILDPKLVIQESSLANHNIPHKRKSL
ncbi:MAG: LacI family DNA-binding transcriptional regulator [Planctomycetes bacterium]|nr:LacI family DNA-binding transcriptional regulator [Planctomycetota bacterium]